MKEKFSIIVGEEKGTKNKAFLIAPPFCNINVGDKVTSGNLTFKVLFFSSLNYPDDEASTILHVALGNPMKVNTVIREEVIDREEDNE